MISTDLEQLWILCCLQTESQRQAVRDMLKQRDKRIAELVAEVNALSELAA